MEEELKLATAALEAGDRKRAQRLLALFLKREPENVHGWLALSQTVDDEKKKRAFLSKVLSIDPLNETARARLVALDEPATAPEPEPVEDVVEDAPAEPEPDPEPEPVPPPVIDVPADSAPEEEEPPWEEEPAGITADEAPATTGEPAETSPEDPRQAEPEPQESAALVPNEEAKTQLFVQDKSSTIIEPKAAYPPATAEEPQLEAPRPDWLLLILTLLAIVVGGYLIYLLGQMLT